MKKEEESSRGELSPFDQRLQLLNRFAHLAPPHVVDAAVYVHDTMKTAQASARTLFGDTVSPEVVLAVFDRISQEHRHRLAKDPPSDEKTLGESE